MNFLRQLLAFYINSSIHVALSCFALINITYFTVNIPSDNVVACFAFFGTIVGYNFVKFDALARANKNKMRSQLKGITAFSFLSLLMTVYFYFKLQNTTKIVAAVFLFLIILYTLPFFPNTKNARNWAGLKIYIVSICWVGVTVILPILNSEIVLHQTFYIIAVQRFLLIFALILIFEIIDLKTDDPHLKTVPQQIGLKKTKILGFILLIVFCGIGFFNDNSNGNVNIQILGLLLNFVIAIVIAIVIASFLFFANENRSKYYTSIWVESVPVFWWLMLIIIN